MRARLTSRFLPIAALVAGLLLVPTAAFAYAPTGDDFITCVAGGDTNVECTIGVFDAGTEISILVTTNPTLLDTTVTAGADGTASFNFDVPDGTPAGDVNVLAEGTKDGAPATLQDDIATIDADGAVIANAGSSAGLLAAGALGALVLGAGALYASRRTRSDAAA